MINRYKITVNKGDQDTGDFVETRVFWGTKDNVINTVYDEAVKYHGKDRVFIDDGFQVCFKNKQLSGYKAANEWVIPNTTKLSFAAMDDIIMRVYDADISDDLKNSIYDLYADAVRSYESIQAAIKALEGTPK